MSRLLLTLFVSIAALLSGPLEAKTADALLRLSQPGHVLLLRHARAPGVGDPDGFVLGDCTTQRNLDATGRQQARDLGELLRSAGLDRARVYTSQWCRCRETARLLALGPVEDLTALNSFFEEPETQAARVQALNEFLDRLPRNGPPVVLVTHQVNITALTRHFPSSGEGLVLQLLPQGGFKRVAEFAFSKPDASVQGNE